MTGPRPTADRYFQRLRARGRATADGRLTTFRGSFAVLRDVVIDVARRSERGVEPGFLRLTGLRLPRLRWRRPRLSRPSLQALLDTVDGDEPGTPAARDRRAHVLVMRGECSDLFHTVTDWYNVFVVQRFLGDPAPRVMLADSRPAVALDAAWSRLFTDVVSLGSLGPGPVRLDTLALAPLGDDSPLLAWRARELPLAAEFRRFVLEAYGRPGVDGPRRPGPLRVTLIRPQDDGGPTGQVPPAIANEPALLQVLRTLADVEVLAVALERLPFGEQLAIVASTDVLVGVHGPALTHALFLPPGAGLMEVFPDHQAPRARHFHRLAEWRGLFYVAWQTPNRGRAHPGRQADVPPAVLVDALRRYAHRPGRRL